MAVIINASTSTGLVQSADTSGIIQFQSNGSTKATLNSSGFSYPGGVLQVVSVNKADSFSTTSTSFTDITGLSVSITPTSASSKIYVVATIPLVSAASGSGANFALSRNGTLIGQGTSGTTQNSIAVVFVNTNDFFNGTSFSILDSPATTSAITYQIRLLSSAGGTCLIGRRGSDTYGGSSSTLTAMEIAV
jgi:hypothetical protein